VTTDKDELGYATALAELEEILDQLEDDDIDVDVLSSKVERAAELIRLCRGRIRAAQISVEEIVSELDDLADGVDPGDITYRDDADDNDD
jgi:exodeoxyribonuclease VII small subunit